MKTESKIFERKNLKGISNELQAEIIQRFNDYDTLIRVMTNVANNLRTMAKTTTQMTYEDKKDIYSFATLLKDATNKEWLRENYHYF